MKADAPAKRKKAKIDSKEETWNLRLYVAGQTQKSITAFANLKKICDEHLAGKYRIEVVDLLKNPQLAKGDQIIALPTLVRKLPEPIKKIIGNLANTGARAGGSGHKISVKRGRQKSGVRSQKIE